VRDEAQLSPVSRLLFDCLSHAQGSDR